MDYKYPEAIVKSSQFLTKSSTTCGKDAYAINIGHGKRLVEANLLTAIENGHLAGAALDVFRDEPLPKDYPFFGKVRKL